MSSRVSQRIAGRSLAVALLAGLASGGCHVMLERNFVSIGTVKASAPSASARRLVVRDNCGTIHLVPSTGSDVLVSAEVKVQDTLQAAAGAGDARRDLRVALDGDTLIVANAHLDASDHDSWQMDLEIEAPPGIPWKIEHGIGETSVTAGGADLDVDLGIGDLKLDGSVASLRVRVGVGNARCAVTALAGGELEAGNGNVALAIRESGPAQPLNCKAGVGNARLELPARANASVDLHAGVGSVRVENAPGVTVVKEFVSGRAAGNVGAGGPAITVTTGTGDVTLAVAR